jgi:histidinol-phosphatase (PHP family)
MEEYVQRASALGIQEMGFSDHAPAARGYDPAHRMEWEEFPLYQAEIHRLRDLYPGVSLRMGVETDFYPGYEPALRYLLKKYPVEYVIGSVHEMRGVFVFQNNGSEFPGNERIRLIQDYFTLLRKGLETDLVDVVGHLDVIKWLFPEETYAIFEAGSQLLQVMSQTGTVLELNTSGLRKKPGETYPGPLLLQEAVRLGVPVCLGSDAHAPEEVGADFQHALNLLSGLGCTHKKNGKADLMVFSAE